MIYLVGSMRNPSIPDYAERLREAGHIVFDDWYAPGPETDEYWQQYAKNRGQTYKEALNDWHAVHVFEFDKFHLDRADTVVLVMPAGRSGHLELGYAAGQGKTTYVLFNEEPDRYDIMYQFADDVFMNFSELLEELENE